MPSVGRDYELANRARNPTDFAGYRVVVGINIGGDARAKASAVRSGRYVSEKPENDFGGFFGGDLAVVDGMPGREVVQLMISTDDVESA